MSFKIVLIEPSIPQNTGNIGRLAVALGLELVLVGKLGFSLSEKKLRRAGMDYWQNLMLSQISLDEFYHSVTDNTCFISTKGSTLYTKIPSSADMIVFGNESFGLPEKVYKMYESQLYRIPMQAEVRSINLATSVGIVSYSIASHLGFKFMV